MINIKTRYVKRYTTPINFIIEQIREDGVIRQTSENNKDFKDWLSNNNILEIIPYTTPAPEKPTLDDAKILKQKEVARWYAIEYNKPLKVSNNPPIYIKQTSEDLNLWEKGIKGFLLTALEQGYFTGPNALTDDELSDLSIGTIRGSVIRKAANYYVSPIDAFGKPILTTLENMVNFTLMMANSFQALFMRYHMLKNYVTYTTSLEMLEYLKNWNTDLSEYGYPPL